MGVERDVSKPVLMVFAPILIGIGLLGFVIPAKKAVTSGAPAYNLFHLVFGSIGIVCVRSPRRSPARLFNLGFGALDVYQAMASRRGWFPENWFRWRKADDVLHVAIGAALIGAAFADMARSSPDPSPALRRMIERREGVPTC